MKLRYNLGRLCRKSKRSNKLCEQEDVGTHIKSKTKKKNRFTKTKPYM